MSWTVIFLFKSNMFTEFYLWSLVSGCDIMLFGLNERRKKNIPVPFLCVLSVPQCFFVLGMLLSLTYTL